MNDRLTRRAFCGLAGGTFALLLGGRVATAQQPCGQVRLWLECHRTKDPGGDSLSLDIFSGAGKWQPKPPTLQPGQQVFIGEFPLAFTTIVRLWERDRKGTWPFKKNRYTCLGEAIFDLSQGYGCREFTQYGAHYRLIYQICR